MIPEIFMNKNPENNTQAYMQECTIPKKQGDAGGDDNFFQTYYSKETRNYFA
jgi:hypothetical protein